MIFLLNFGNVIVEQVAVENKAASDREHVLKFVVVVNGIAREDDFFKDGIFHDVEGYNDAFGNDLEGLISLVEIAGVHERVSVAQSRRCTEGIADVFKHSRFDRRKGIAACALERNINNRLALELLKVFVNLRVDLRAVRFGRRLLRINRRSLNRRYFRVWRFSLWSFGGLFNLRSLGRLFNLRSFGGLFNLRSFGGLFNFWSFDIFFDFGIFINDFDICGRRSF